MFNIFSRVWAGSFRAAAIHLLFSVLFVGIAAVVTFKVWYPVPLATATGVLAIFKIVIMAAFVSGPLLTLIVYKKNKKSLRSDLAIIVMIQLSILFYGIYSLAQARPIWLTFYNNRFELVRINDVEDINLVNASKKYTTPSFTGPKWVAAKPSGSLSEIEDLKLWNRMGAKIAYNPNFYYSIEEAYPLIKKKAYELSSLTVANNDVDINRQVKKYPKAVGWLPLWAQEQHMVVLIDKDGAPIATVNLRPWTKNQMNTIITTTIQ